jgi:hypothetical protein
LSIEGIQCDVCILYNVILLLSIEGILCVYII